MEPKPTFSDPEVAIFSWPFFGDILAVLASDSAYPPFAFLSPGQTANIGPIMIESHRWKLKQFLQQMEDI